jgi:hypothetical protein
MSSDPFFPEQRHMQAFTLIRRERVLPDGAFGRVETAPGARVGFRDVIARGAAIAPYTWVEAAAALRLRRPEALGEYLQVAVDDTVDAGQVLAQKRRRRVLAPIMGRVAAVQAGRIILQAMAESIELESGMNGQVVDVRRGRGAVIETVGAVLQGVWGSGRRALGTLRMEPPDGLEGVRSDAISTQYRGAIVVTRRPLTELRMGIIAAQGFAGVIAPSAEALLVPLMQASPAAVLLTEGFGTARMNISAVQFLDQHDGRQGALDAIAPAAGEARRPEIILTVPVTGDRPLPPPLNLTVGVGGTVRIAAGHAAGASGIVVEIARGGALLENGLRVPAATVELSTGERVVSPLANLEVSG